MAIGRSRGGEEAPDTDVTPMLNLMVMLIPFLLTSSEFVKIGAIEMKLPESTRAAGGGAAETPQTQEGPKLNLGIVITDKGFSVYSYFRDSKAQTSTTVPDIPLMADGAYDFTTLNTQLADIKKRALIEILRPYDAAVSESMSLSQLYNEYSKMQPFTPTVFLDHESVKIVAQEAIKYKNVVAVMDASRGTHTPDGNVTMFPNVAIAGGIAQ